jgi:hypothetical protein
MTVTVMGIYTQMPTVYVHAKHVNVVEEVKEWL